MANIFEQFEKKAPNPFERFGFSSQETVPSEDDAPPAAPTEEGFAEMQKDIYVPPEEPSRGIGDVIGGIAETAYQMPWNIGVGGVAQMLGTVKGIARTIDEGTFGTQKGAQSAEKYAQEFANTFIAQPETQTGQDIAEAVGKVSVALEGLGPMASQLQSVGTSAKLGRLARKAPKQPSKGVGVTQILGEAEASKIPVMTSDVVKPDTFFTKWVRGIGEKIPVTGTGKKRATQKVKRIEAVKDTLREYGIDEVTQAADEVTKSILDKRSTDINKYKNLKGDVISRATDGKVTLDRTFKAIDSEIEGLKSLKTVKLQPVIEILEDWKSSLTDQNLTNVETLRKQVGEVFKDQNLESVKTAGEKALRRIYNPLREDMGDYIKSTGDAKDFVKWKLANKRLANISEEFNKASLKKILKKGEETPEVVQNILFGQKPSEVKSLYKNLDLKGKGKAKIALFNEALSKSLVNEQVSADKFLNNVKKLGNQFGIFLSKKEKAQLDGLSRALTITKRAEEYTPTGMATVPFIGGAALASIFGSTGGAIVGGGSIGGLARLYESAPVRNAFIRLGKTKAGTPGESKALIGLVTAIQAGRPEQQEEQE